MIGNCPSRSIDPVKPEPESESELDEAEAELMRRAEAGELSDEKFAEADCDDSVARFEVVEDQVHGAVKPARLGARIESLDDAPAIDADVKAVRARVLAMHSMFYVRISGITWP